MNIHRHLFCKSEYIPHLCTTNTNTTTNIVKVFVFQADNIIIF